ncbi:MAG: kelch repeat-containing protein [Bacillota bacterium]
MAIIVRKIADLPYPSHTVLATRLSNGRIMLVWGQWLVGGAWQKSQYIYEFNPWTVALQGVGSIPDQGLDGPFGGYSAADGWVHAFSAGGPLCTVPGFANPVVSEGRKINPVDYSVVMTLPYSSTPWVDVGAGYTGTWTCAAVVPSGRIYLFCDSKVYYYEPASGYYTSSPIATLPISYFSHSGAAYAANGRIYLFGGGAGTLLHKQIIEFNPSNNTSVVVADLPSARRGARPVAHPNGKIYVFGGYTGTDATNEIIEFDPNTKSVSVVGYMPQNITSMGVALGGDNNIYLFGGWIKSSPGAVTEIYRLFVDATPPEAPVLSATVNNQDRTVTLNWTEVSTALSYKVQRSTDGISFSTIATVSALSYIDADLPYQTYYYRVVGVNELGDGAPSNVVVAELVDPITRGLTRFYDTEQAVYVPVFQRLTSLFDTAQIVNNPLETGLTALFDTKQVVYVPELNDEIFFDTVQTVEVPFNAGSAFFDVKNLVRDASELTKTSLFDTEQKLKEAVFTQGEVFFDTKVRCLYSNPCAILHDARQTVVWPHVAAARIDAVPCMRKRMAYYRATTDSHGFNAICDEAAADLSLLSNRASVNNAALEDLYSKLFEALSEIAGRL